MQGTGQHEHVTRQDFALPKPDPRAVESERDHQPNIGQTFVLPQCEAKVLGSRDGRLAESAKLSSYRSATRGSRSPMQLEQATQPEFTAPHCEPRIVESRAG